MIKFGIFVQSTPARGNYNFLREAAITCETYGFHSFWLNDHFIPLPSEESKNSFLECWSVLSALVSVTKTLRLGTLCTNISYRFPSLVAKMGATIDNISNGRFEFGVGAGWYKREYIMYGVPFPKSSTRITQLNEGLQIIKKMWVEEESYFQGKHYRIKGALNYPKPIQKPHPPILIGTLKVQDKMIETILKFANIWNTPLLTFEDYKQKLERFKRKCETSKDPKNIENSLLCTVHITENHKELLNKARKFKAIDARLHEKGIFEKILKISSEEYLQDWCIAGTPENCIEKIKKYINIGVTYFIVTFPEMDFFLNLRTLQLFGEVIQAFTNK